ncbi:O-antigen ligase family protein [Flavobacterium sp.]|uniref:O-antigen ligase family protein n=1 Tax=Flavobacterium sp. TaxID=239 RepID=UPI002486D487|nr:O-antigen ligase family protein [Flavobacterium sp.]MDI1316044.1 O-antigen ligase family protein [Flavobacterium sp.]
MTERQQINLTLLHVGIGSLIAFHLPLSKIYLLLIIILGFYIVVKNKNNEILYVIAYIAGSEVFLRTTYGNHFYELGKYLMLFFTFLGFFYSGFPKIKNPYLIYLLVLFPSVFLSLMYINGDVRKTISIEILGPICLGVLALYTYKREISAKQIKIILNLIALPVLGSCVFLILRYSRNIYSVNPYASNFYFSGNYAPNQMATVLGLGFFIYLLKIIIESDSKKIFYLNLFLLCLISYRGFLTFSRGGILTAVITILFLFLSIYISRKEYYTLKRKISLSFILFLSIFALTSCQTQNKLFSRYTNLKLLDSKYFFKNDGRYIQAKSDFENFIEKPILGVGVGKAKEIRIIKYKKEISTHSEVTRLLSEHGILGLVALLILIFYPLQLYSKDLRNFYLLPFFVFWLLTINHSATRVIAPLFLYALTLLQIKFEKEEDVI